MHIYVASSWRNPHQPRVIQALEAHGHTPYDFRNPPHGDGGFDWRQIAGAPDNVDEVDHHTYQALMSSPEAHDGYYADFDAMNTADLGILVLPAGNSSHLETGWLTGRGIPTAIYSPDETLRPDLMYRMTDGLFAMLATLLRWVNHHSDQRADRDRLRQW